MRIPLALVLVLALPPASASALTIQEVTALSKAGVSDDVLLALIDRDKPVFSIDPDALIALKRDGVSERIVLAMLRTGRREPQEVQTAPVTVTGSVPTEPRIVMFGHGPQRPNTYHEFDRLGLSEPAVTYVVPYYAPYVVPSLLPRVAPEPPGIVAPCQAGRTVPGVAGLADASARVVNGGLLPVVGAADPGAAACAQTPLARPGPARRPRR